MTQQIDVCPDEWVAAVTNEAERDAELAVVWLSQFGDPASFDLPSYAWLGLGSIMRVYAWERQGIFAHREAGIPSSAYLLKDWLSRLTRGAVDELKTFGFGLNLWVEQISLAQLAVTASGLLGAEVELGKVNEDDLVEIVAEMLWKNRHRMDSR